MKRTILYLIGLIATVIPVTISAQSVGNGLNGYIANTKNTKNINELIPNRYTTENINGKEYISLIMEVDKDCDLSFLKKYDCKIGSKTAGIVTLRVNTNDLTRLIKEKEIKEIEISRKCGAINLSNAVVDFEAAKVWNGIDLLESYTGKDVLIGVADWGIDYTHPTFYDSLLNEDSYRIVAAWDQFRNQGPAPEGFSYGTVFTDKESLLAARCDTANQLDTGYHSTHCGGIAAGSGAGTKYKGVAYEANLIFCTWIPDEAHYIECCTWMNNVAKSLNKRLVINNSWGIYNIGRMDGESMLDKFINAMSQDSNIVFVISAGNNGGAMFHIEADFNKANTDTLRSEIQFNFPTPYSNEYWGEVVTLQSENGAPFASKLEFYDYAWNKFGETPLMQADGSTVPVQTVLRDETDSIIYSGASRSSKDKVSLVDWEVRQSRYVSNTDHIVLCIVADSGKVHAWNLNKNSKSVGNTGFNFLASQNGYLQGDNTHGVSEPGLAEKAITVAAHQFKANQWNPEICGFSSRGPNITNYYKPEISAPGYSIMSSVSSFSANAPKSKDSIVFNGRSYFFGSASGTSMSGPMVTGAVALMLQANPNLTPDEVMQLIIETAKTDDYTEQCPNDIWGYGKLNAYQAVKAAEKKVGLAAAEDLSITVYPVPAKDILYIEGITPDNTVYVCDITGRNLEVKKLNSETLDIKHLSSGVYILNINDKGTVKKIKFIKN